MKSTTKLVPLWIILVALIILTLWSVKQLAMVIVKTTAKTSDMSLVKTDPYAGSMGMGYGGGFNNYCLTMPIYPALSSSMMPGTVMTKEDKIAMEKYEQDMQKYNEEYAAACKLEQKKQEELRAKDGRFSWLSGVVVYVILSFIGIFSSALTLLVIKRNELEV